jgi:hypothetical protein
MTSTFRGKPAAAADRQLRRVTVSASLYYQARTLRGVVHAPVCTQASATARQGGAADAQGVSVPQVLATARRPDANR